MKWIILPIETFVILSLIVLLTACAENNDAPKEKEINNTTSPLSSVSLADFPPSLPEQTLTTGRALSQKWDLVSFPIKETTNLQSFLISHYTFQNIQQVWQWDHYLGNNGGWRVYPQLADFPVLSEIHPDAGYWIRANKEFTFFGGGNAHSNYNFIIGWNLIGYSHAAPQKTISEFLSQGDFWRNNCGGGETVVTIWSWHNNNWKVYFPDDEDRIAFNNQHNTSIEPLTTLKPGIGIWVQTALETCSTTTSTTTTTSSTTTTTLLPSQGNSFPLTLDHPFLGTIGASEQRNSLVLSPTKGHSYQMQVSRQSLMGNFSFGCYEASLCDKVLISRQELDGVISFTAPSSEPIYFYLASTYPDMGSYSVEVTHYEDDYGNSTDLAIPLIDGEFISGVREIEGDRDAFYFTPTIGLSYQFKMSPSQKFYTYECNTVCVAHIATRYSDSDISTFTAQSNEPIYFFRSQSGLTDFYSAQIKSYTDDHGNNADYATSISIETTVAGNFEVERDHDSFVFIPTAGTAYQIKLIRDSLNGAFRLGCEDADLCQANYVNGGEREGSITVTPQSTEPIYFYAKSADGTGAYFLETTHYSDDHDNHNEGATPFPSSGGITGNINVKGDRDNFSFTPIAGQTYQIKISEATENGSVFLRCYDLSLCQEETGKALSFATDSSDPLYFSLQGGNTGTYALEINRYRDDHGGQIASASTISLDSPISGNLEVLGDSDMFYFAPTQGNSYNIQITRNTLSGPFRAKCEEPLLCGGNTFSDDRNGTLYVTAGSSNPIYFSVTASDAIGSYTIKTLIDDHGNDVGYSTLISEDVPLAGTFEVPSDLDYFRFIPALGKSYQIKLVEGKFYGGISFSCYNWSLCGGPPNHSGNQETISFTTLSTTPIYFSIDPYFFSSSTTGTYSLEVTSYSDDHGNHRESATLVSENNFSGNLEVAGDKDVFLLTPTVDITYQITVERDSLNGAYEIGCGNNSNCRNRTIDSSEIEGVTSFQASTTDTLSFYVSGLSDTTGTYSVQLNSYEDDHGNNENSATEITLEESIVGNIEIKGDRDVFRFHPTVGEGYQIKFIRNTFSGPVSLNRFPYYTYSVISSEVSEGSISFKATSESPFYFVIDFPNHEIWTDDNLGTYTVEVVRVVDDFGNDSESAMSITVGETIDGNIEFTGDNDMFRFIPEEGRFYRIRATSDELGYSLNLQCLEPLTCHGPESIWGDNSLKRFQAQSNEPIYFYVSGNNSFFSSRTGSYSVGIFEDDHGDDTDSATLISTGETISGNLDFVGDSDFFSFMPTIGKSYQINVTRGTIEETFVLNCDNTSICRQTTLSGSKIESFLSFKADSPEAVYFYVEGDTAWYMPNTAMGTYSIEILEYTDDHGDTTVAATSLSNGGVVSGNLELHGDLDYFSFVPQPGVSYQIQVTRDTLSGDFNLYCDNVCQGYTIYGYRSQNVSSFTASSNTPLFFYVTSSDKIGTYSIQITSYTDDYGSTPETASSITEAEPTAGNLEVSSDQDHFSFIPTAGLSYQLKVIPNASDGSFNIGCDNYFLCGHLTISISGSEKIISFTANSIDPFNFYIYGKAGKYSVEIVSYTDDYSNNPESATTVTVGESIAGNMEVKRDYDFFQLIPTEGESYHAIAVPSAELGFVNISCSGNLSCRTAYFGSEMDIINFTAESAEPIYFYTSAHGIGTYSLDIVKDDHGSNGAETLLSLGETNLGNLEVKGDSDHFMFNPTIGTAYQIKVTRNTLIGSFDFDCVGSSPCTDQTIASSASEAVSRFKATSERPIQFSIESFSSEGTYSVEVTALADDYGDDTASAASITEGKTMLGSLEAPGDKDYFRFIPATGRSYQINAAHDTGNGRFYLYCVDTNLCNASQIPSGTSRGIVLFTANSTEPIYFYTYSQSGFTSYTLEISSYSDDHGNHAASGTHVEVGESISGNLEISRDRDVFNFEPTETSYEMTASRSSLNGFFQLGCEHDLCEATWIHDASEGIANFKVSSTNTVSVYIFSPAYTGTYSLVINPIPDDHGDTPQSATSISIKDQVEGNLEVRKDRDYFSFTPKEGTFYQIKVTRNTVTDYFYLRCQNSSLCNPDMISNSESKGEVRLTAPSTDPIYFYVESASQATGTYFIEIVEDDHNNHPDYATPISKGDFVEGNFEVKGDRDYFRFTPNTNTFYQIKVIRDTVNGSFSIICHDPSLCGRDDLGSYESEGQIGFTTSSTNPIDFYVTSSSGVGTYSVIVNTDDHENEMAQATSISVGEQVSGDLEYSTDQDYFKFIPTTGLSYQIKITRDSFQGDFSLHCTDSSLCGEVFMESFNSYVGTVFLTAPSPGPVYFYVHNTSSYVGTYLVEILIDDHSNQQESASTVLINETTSGKLEVSGDRDYFRFTPVAGTSYQIKLNQPSTEGTLTLYCNEGHNCQATSTQTKREGTTSFTANSTAPLYFYVRSHLGHTALYSVEITSYADDYGSSAEEATAISVASPLSGELEVTGDRDFFYVTPTVGTSYQIKLSRGTLDGTVYLYCSDPSLCGGAMLSHHSEYAFSFNANSTDPFYFYVSSFNSEGTYTLEIITDDHGSNKESATFVDVGKPISGAFEVASDKDYFSFTPTEKESYQIKVLRGDLNGAFSLICSDNACHQAYLSATESEKITAFKATSNEPIFFYVTSANNTGTYSIEITTLTDDYGDNTDSAQLISIGESVSGTLEVDGDKDAFRFNPIAGNSYLVKVQRGTLTDAFSLSCHESICDTVRLSKDLLDQTTSFTANSGDPVYFFVRANEYYGTPSKGIGTYSIIIVEDDHGGKMDVATPLSETESTLGNIQIKRDLDYFKYPLTKGVYYQFKIVRKTLTGKFYMVCPRNSVCVSVESNESEGHTGVTATSNGDFYFYVTNFSDNTGTYSVEVIADDHGNSIDLATLVTENETTTGTLEFSEDHDYFQFIPVAGAYYEIKVTKKTSSGSLKLSCFIFTVCGSTETLFNDLSEGQVYFQAPSSNPIQFYVASPAKTLGPYSLQITKIEDDYGNTVEAAQSVAIGESISGNFEISGDRDVFYFPALVGTTYRITVTNPSPENQTVGCIDSEWCERGTIGEGTHIIVSPSSTDSVYFYVESQNQGTYSVEIAGYTDDHGNNPETATPLSLDNRILGNLEVTGDRDYFRFSLIAGKLYQIKVARDSLDQAFSFHCYDTDDCSEHTMASGQTEISLDFAATSEEPISIYIDSHAAQTGTYFIEVTTLPDDHSHYKDAATSISIGETVEGNLQSTGDRDYFSFVPVEGKAYVITIERGTLINYFYLRCVNSLCNGVTIGTGESKKITSFQAETSEPFYFYVDSVNSNSYSISASGRKGTYTVTVTQAEDDFGNSIDTATVLSVGTSVTGRIQFLGDRDYFQVASTTTQAYHIKLNRVSAFSRFGLNCEFSSDCESISLVDFEMEGTTSLTVTPLAPVYLYASASQSLYFDNYTGDYSLEMIAEDHSNKADFATTVPIEEAIAGNLETTNDKDYFSFTPVIGNFYHIQLTNHEVAGYLYLRCADSSTCPIIRHYGAGSEGVTSFQATSSDPIFFYVNSSNNNGATGSYSVQVLNDDHGGSAASATTVSAGETIVGALTLDDDDYFSLSTTQGTSYQIKLIRGSIEGLMRLSCEDSSCNTWILNDESEGTSSFKVHSSNPDPIIFYISSWSVGTYSLEITNYQDDHGDNTDTSTALSLDEEVSGNLEISEDTDYFNFVPTEGELYQILVTRGTLGELYTLNCVMSYVCALDMNASSDLQTVISFKGSSSAPFYFNVSPAKDSQGTYTIKVIRITDDHGDTPTSATSIAADEVAFGNRETSADRDYFSFTPTIGQLYQIKVTRDDLKGTLPFACNDTSICPSTTMDAKESDGVLHFQTDSVTPVYFFVGPSANLGTYSVEITTSTDDHGNDTETATSLEIGTTISGHIELFGDKDYFQFTPMAGTSYQMLVGRIGSSGGFSVRCSDTSLCQGGLSSGNLESTIFFTANSAAPIDFYVSSFLATGTYTIKVMSEDHGSRPSNGTLISLGEQIPGNLELGNDKDYFQFTPTLGNTYQIRATRDDLVGSFTIACQSVICRGHVPQAYVTGNANFKALSTDPIYFYIYSYSGNVGSYFVEVNNLRDDHGDSIDSATSLQLYDTITANVEASGDLDYFYITPSAGTGYQIKVFRNTLGGRFYLRCHDVSICSDAVIDNRDSEGSFSFTTNSSDPVYFYIEATPGSSNIGRYSMQILPQ